MAFITHKDSDSNEICFCVQKERKVLFFSYFFHYTAGILLKDNDYMLKKKIDLSSLLVRVHFVRKEGKIRERALRFEISLMTLKKKKKLLEFEHSS